MTRLAGLGLSVDLPGGWDGRIYGREAGADPGGGGGGAGGRAALHAGTFPLPNQRGDFGGGAVELMSDDDVIVMLLEYDPACTGQALFRADGPPPSLDAAAFSPTVLQRSVPGQAGSQTFFSARERAFCLYVVLGQLANRARLVPLANQVVSGIRVE